MTAQFFLGIIQLLLAIYIRLTYFKTLSDNIKKMYRIYWLFVLLAIINITLVTSTATVGSVSLYTIFSLLIFPILIAGYFVYITYTIKEEFNKSLK